MGQNSEYKNKGSATVPKWYNIYIQGQETEVFWLY